MTFRPGRILGLGVSFLLSLSVTVHADVESSGDAQFTDGTRTRGLVGGWGHSWRPIFGQTRSEITFVALTPRMGWFVHERLEIYGEGTLFVYDRPQAAIAAGPQLAGRYYLKTHGGWIPYVHGGAGLLWTSLDV